MKEILERRNYNSKHFDLLKGESFLKQKMTVDLDANVVPELDADGKNIFESVVVEFDGQHKKIQSHIGHIHHKDNNGVFQESDITPVDMGTYWEMTKHNYHLKVMKDFSAPTLMEYVNKYEGANHTITYEPHSLAWYNNLTDDVQIFRNQQAVTGVFKPKTNSFYYTNAFGNGIDFEITIQRSGFKKEVVIPNKPSVFPTAPSVDYNLVALFKYGGTGLNVLSGKTKRLWNGNDYFESSDGFQLEESNPLMKSFIKPAYGVDANGNKRSLRVMWKKRNNQLWQIKEIPLKAMENTTFPIRFDTVTSYYTGAGDGFTYYNNDTWATARDSASSSGSVYNTAEDWGMYIRRQTIGYYYLYRLFLPFDTSGLPTGANISAADVKIYLDGSQYKNDFTTTAYLVPTTQASTSVLATSDHGKITFTDHGNKLWGVTTPAWFTIPMNSTGYGAINDSGYTKLAMISDYDFSDTEPITTLTNSCGGYLHMSENASEDPYIEITYTTGTDHTLALTETATIVDTVTKEPSRSLTETATIVDSISKQASIFLSDITTIVDGFSSTKVTTKALTEITTITDTFSRTINKFFTETTVVVDNLTKTISRSLTETTTIIDDVLAEIDGLVTLALDEVLTITDSLIKTTSKFFTESVVVADTFSFLSRVRGFILGKNKNTNTGIGKRRR